MTFLAAFVPTFGALGREITAERRTTRRVERAPFWQRTYLDLLLLGTAVLLISSLNGGFKPSGNEGTAIALSFNMFLAPFCAWVGLMLLVLRLVEHGLRRGIARLATLFRRLFGDIGEVAGKSIGRRTVRVSAATTVIALTLSFGVSLALFQQTYASEKQLDAQYVVGSDIRVTPALNTRQTVAFADQLRAVAGVTGVTAVARDTQALVGAERMAIRAAWAA